MEAYEQQTTIRLRADAIGVLLTTHGLRPVLRELNRGTWHRYTGIYQFAPPLLRSISLYDRENPEILVADDTPMSETYCSIVCEGMAPFRTDNAPLDHRLLEHPARHSVLAYCGAPLFGSDGVCFGSLCHFDLRPRLLRLSEVDLLMQVAPTIARAVEAGWLAQRPGPGLNARG